jgi:hypothetical protein
MNKSVKDMTRDELIAGLKYKARTATPIVKAHYFELLETFTLEKLRRDYCRIHIMNNGDISLTLAIRD